MPNQPEGANQEDNSSYNSRACIQFASAGKRAIHSAIKKAKFYAHDRYRQRKIEYPHNATSRPARFGMWIGALVLLVNGIYAYFSWGQLKEMRDEKRAWISVKIEIASRPVWSKYNEIFYFKYAPKNTGQSPAMNVVFKPLYEISLPEDRAAYESWLRERDQKCDAIRHGDVTDGGIAIFPGDGDAELFEHSISQRNLADPSTGENAIAAKQSAQFVIFGCVNYRTVDGVVHQTPFFFTMKRPGSRNYPFQSPQYADIPWPIDSNHTEELILVPELERLPSPD